MNDLSRRKFLSLTAQGVIISAFLPSALQAAMSNKPAVVAVMKNWNRFQSDPNAYISQMKLFTDTYKKYSKVSTSCLLYTSDAADEEDSVDLGGRRIIKKKK